MSLWTLFSTLLHSPLVFFVRFGPILVPRIEFIHNMNYLYFYICFPRVSEG